MIFVHQLDYQRKVFACYRFHSFKYQIWLGWLL